MHVTDILPGVRRSVGSFLNSLLPVPKNEVLAKQLQSIAVGFRVGVNDRVSS